MFKQEKLKELVTCPVCLDQFKDPKMLPCQHTFCLLCIRKFSCAQPKEQQIVKEKHLKIKCAQCRSETAVSKEGFESLPTNIYVKSLLDLLATLSEKETPKSCKACDTLCAVRKCEHCHKSYCTICEQRHLSELEQELSAIRQQLMTAKSKLCHRAKLFANDCDQVKENVHIEIQNRVKQILETESQLVKQIDTGVERGKAIAETLHQKLDESAEKITEYLKEDFDSPSYKTAEQKNVKTPKNVKVLYPAPLPLFSDAVKIAIENRAVTDHYFRFVQECAGGLIKLVERPGKLDYTNFCLTVGDQFLFLKDKDGTMVRSELTSVSCTWLEAIEKHYELLISGLSRAFKKNAATSTGQLKLLVELHKNVLLKKDNGIPIIDLKKISTFLDIHNLSSELLKATDVVELGSVTFCPDSLAVLGLHSEDEINKSQQEQDYEIAELAIIEENHSSSSSSSVVLEMVGNRPYSSLESDDAHSLYYRSRPFLVRCRLGSTFVQRPCGVAVSPWVKKEIFVVSMDTHRVYVFDIDRKKFLRSFGSRGQRSGEFMCPSGIAISAVTREIYVTDKWKHCIHVFDEAENFVRQIGSKGSGEGQFRSPESITVDNNTGKIYVCDTINNRIQVLSKDGVFLREIDGQIPIPHHVVSHRHHNRHPKRNLFQELAGIAVTPDGSRLVVCDFANHRIHVFGTRDGLHIFTCGQKGSLRGQFNNPECVAVDNKGFIFVGDSGNSRIQILRPDGRFVLCFGTRGALPGHFNWISGLALTDTKEVIVSDFKNHCIQIF